jgi:hypothetical protein
MSIVNAMQQCSLLAYNDDAAEVVLTLGGTTTVSSSTMRPSAAS